MSINEVSFDAIDEIFATRVFTFLLDLRFLTDVK